jgi:translation initiation factor 2-alpha kinase 4
LAEAEAIKVAAEVVAKFPVLELYEVRLNHRHILAAIWAWAGVKQADRRSVAQLLAVMGGAAPRSSARKALWPLVRRQLLQDLQVAESVVDRLQTVERRLSGNADDALARLRGALPPCASTSTAIDELSMLLSYMRVWDLDKLVTIDALMPPTAEYFDGIYFQVHVQKANLNLSTHDMIRPVCLAVGGRYDNLLNKYWAPTAGLNLPGAVGLSIGLQKLIYAATAERKQEATVEVLVCSRGGGGLLVERMQVVAELWAANIKAEYVCAPAPSLTEQYEYAHEHGIKWLVIITEAGLSLTGNVKVSISWAMVIVCGFAETLWQLSQSYCRIMRRS